MTLEADRFYMALALDLAARGVGTTSPNPMVGCVIAKGGRIVGRGFHERAGMPHAEVVALKEAGAEARGADLYVTLEPCSHQGRTPPCADALIGAGVKRVVVAMEDPNSLVAGAGLGRLAAAGVETSVGILGEEAKRLNEAFILSITQKRAFVHLKLAATLDGRIATGSGDSKWITSPESRERVHRLRARTGAVMVGVGTALADDPRLTVRLPGQPERAILRVVLDKNLRIGLNLAMLSPGDAAATMVVCAEGADQPRAERLEAKGAKVLRVAALADGSLDLKAVLEALYRLGRMEVLVEGGAHTARALLDARLVDRCHFFYAPRLLGGRNSLGMIGGESPDSIAKAVGISGMEVERCGPDLYVTGVPVWNGE